MTGVAALARVGRSKGPTSSQSERPRTDAAGTVGQVGGGRSRSAHLTHPALENVRRLGSRCNKSRRNQLTAIPPSVASPHRFSLMQRKSPSPTTAGPCASPGPPRPGQGQHFSSSRLPSLLVEAPLQLSGFLPAFNSVFVWWIGSLQRWTRRTLLALGEGSMVSRRDRCR